MKAPDPASDRIRAYLNQMAAQLQDNLDGMRAFVANASHELRTPLTAMRLNTEALQGGALEDPAVSRRFLAQLEDEIDLMSRTVNDLLDLSRIESNRNLPMTVEIDLKALVEETVQLWNNRTAQARLTLRYNNPVEAAVILGDEDQLRRRPGQVGARAFQDAVTYAPADLDARVGLAAQIRAQRVGGEAPVPVIPEDAVNVPGRHLPEPRALDVEQHVVVLVELVPVLHAGVGRHVREERVEAHPLLEVRPDRGLGGAEERRPQAFDLVFCTHDPSGLPGERPAFFSCSTR